MLQVLRAVSMDTTEHSRPAPNTRSNFLNQRRSKRIRIGVSRQPRAENTTLQNRHQRAIHTSCSRSTLPSGYTPPPRGRQAVWARTQRHTPRPARLVPAGGNAVGPELGHSHTAEDQAGSAASEFSLWFTTQRHLNKSLAIAAAGGERG